MRLPVREHLLVTMGTLGVAGLILWGAWTLPLGREIEKPVPPGQNDATLLLTQGSVLRQEFVAPVAWQTGVNLYLMREQVTDERFLVRILDAERSELARTDTWRRVSFFESDDTVRLEYDFPWVELPPIDSIRMLEVTLLSGGIVPIRVASDSSHGDLTYDGAGYDADISFDVVVASRLTYGTRQGVVVGVVFLLGVLLISWLSAAWQWVAAGGLLLGVTPLSLLGFWLTRGNLGIADWDLYFSYHEIVRRTVLLWRQVPLWNTHLCGGAASLGDPEFPLFTLTFIPELLFGIPTGFPLAIFISIAGTALGMLALGKKVGLSVYAALLAALAGGLGSVSILEIVEGHPNVFAAMWLPWIFWAWLGAYRSRRATGYLLTGIFLALTFYAGGIYLLMYTGLALLLLIVLAGNHVAALKTTVYATLWALGLAAGKLIPVLLWLRQFPDDGYASSAFTLPWLVEILAGRNLHGAYLIYQQSHGWHEYGAYVGFGVLIMAAIGLARWRSGGRLVPVLAVAVVVATLLSAMGPVLIPLFDLLSFFPRSNISRIIIMAVFPIAILAGLGLDVVRSRLSGLSGKWWQTAALALSILIPGFVAVDILSLSYQLSHQAFVLPYPYRLPPRLDGPVMYTTERFDDSGVGNRNTRAYAATLRGYGTFAYCSVLGPEPSVRTIQDKVDSAYISVRPDTARVELVRWSPNEVEVIITATEDTQVVLNTNYVMGWVVNGKSVAIESNRPSTNVAPGIHRLRFQYRAPGYPAGFMVTFGTMAYALVVLRYRKE